MASTSQCLSKLDMSRFHFLNSSAFSCRGDECLSSEERLFPCRMYTLWTMQLGGDCQSVKIPDLLKVVPEKKKSPEEQCIIKVLVTDNKSLVALISMLSYITKIMYHDSRTTVEVPGG